MRRRFSEKVGIVLTISKATMPIHTAFRIGERAIQKPHSKLANIGTLSSHAPADAGTPLKKFERHGGGSAASCVLNRASRRAQRTAYNSTIAQPMLCSPDIVHR